MKNRYSHIMRKYMLTAVAAAIMLILGAAAHFAGRFTAIPDGVVITAEALGGIVILLVIILFARKRRETIAKYIRNIIDDDDGLSGNILNNVSMPMAVCGIDGTIRWYNDMFLQMFDDKRIPHALIDECIPGLKWSEVLRCREGKTFEAELKGHIYSATWRMIKDNLMPNKLGDHYSVFFFFSDVTHVRRIERAYRDGRTDIVFVNVDNYDDYAQKSDDDILDATSSKIRSAVAAWAKKSNAVLKKTDRDRYFIAFEHQYLEQSIRDNFAIMDKVREIAEEAKFPLSLSIGIGTGGTISENETRARNALELALGRGGGQVCVKDDNQFRFYGGKNMEYERSSRVKARAVALALRDFISESDNVIFMGHRMADFDCFGAAVGLQRVVRSIGKTPYIVHERISPSIDTMYNILKGEPEYNGMFVDETEVFEEVTTNTLLVILDTHRPSMLPCPKLLQKVNKVVLIDHHRRSTEFISPCSLVYHEPYASSTCEMVTELIEYIGVSADITKSEAQCIYTGILMDTKNFMLKTGVRTFEAASYLRKLGLDTIAVRKMFCTTKDDYQIKSEIVNAAHRLTEHIAVSKTNRDYRNIKTVASQAADEMLSIENVDASVVVYPADGGAGFCARSVGTINVQLIMERLGGGGHMTVSGAYIKGIGVDEGEKRVIAAIKAYLAELKN